MICFFTSATGPFQTPALYTENGFVDRLREALPGEVRGLWVTNDPADWVRAEPFALEVRDAFVNAGFRVAEYAMLDNRNADRAQELLARANLLILSGGDVAVQNRFFARIRLRELLQDWDGVLVSISAGSMNSAEEVYCPSDIPGEAVEPHPVVLQGLGLTRFQILPHFQFYRTLEVKGLSFEDFIRAESKGRELLALNDGSYIYKDANGNETVCGEAYRIADGNIVPYCGEE